MQNNNEQRKKAESLLSKLLNDSSQDTFSAIKTQLKKLLEVQDLSREQDVWAGQVLDYKENLNNNSQGIKKLVRERQNWEI